MYARQTHGEPGDGDRAGSGAQRPHRLRLQADNVKSNDATLPLIADPAIRRAGTTHVLAVGINSYANPQFDLRYAVADAEDFSSEMQRQAAVHAPGTPIDVTVLRDQQANKAAVLRAIAALAARSQPEDTVMIFFAGHGLASGARFYLVPHDLGFDGDSRNGSMRLR